MGALTLSSSSVEQSAATASERERPFPLEHQSLLATAGRVHLPNHHGVLCGNSLSLSNRH